MIRVENLSAFYGKAQALRDVTLHVDEGETIAIVGANGAGKSTLLKMMCGLYVDFSGEIDWQVARHPLYLGHKSPIKPLLTVVENLDWLCRLQGTTVNDFSSVLTRFGLSNVPCSQLSEGQKKRVALARLMLIDREAWLLDEPFSALDDLGRDVLEGLLSQHIANGGIALVTSHQPVNGATQQLSLS